MPRQPKAMTIIGWILAFPVVALLLFSAFMKFNATPEMLDGFTKHFGYPQASLRPIAIAEVASALLFLFPRTAVLGAILLTGYIGGAIATHVRVEENFLTAAILPVVAWLSLFLRDPRIRALLPFRSSSPLPTTSSSST